jgi:hypothetical protein
MTAPVTDPLSLRLQRWGCEEIQRTSVRWTPEFLLMKAWLVQRDVARERVASLELLGWILATASGLLGLWMAWPVQHWVSLLDSPALFLPPLLSLGLLGRGIWVLIHA